MAREKFQFHCTECSKYFDFLLNTALNGNYRIHCPNCGHIHYRTLKNGDITDTRFDKNDNNILIEDIYPMKASCRDFNKEKREQSVPQGFLSRLWSEFHSAKTI